MQKDELHSNIGKSRKSPDKAQGTGPAKKYFFRLFIAILLIILMVYIAVPTSDLVIGPCSIARPVDTAISELNGRENLLWANAKISDKQFLTDADIDSEIVQARLHGSVYTDLGPDYEWTLAPTATGGSLLYKSREEWVFYRTPATLEKEATWST